MTHQASAPYADPEPMSALAEECRCVEAECTAHGVDLHGHRPDAHTPAEPVVITETVGHLVDGLDDYGS